MSNKTMRRITPVVLAGLVLVILVIPNKVDNSDKKTETDTTTDYSLCAGFAAEMSNLDLTSTEEVEQEEVNVEENETESVTASYEVEWQFGFTNCSARIRREPNTDSEILGTCSINEYVTYYNYSEDWVQIKYGNEFAYIAKSLISDERTYVYPDEDLKLFASIIYLEAGGESRECMLYVGSVILNRVATNFGGATTIQEVVSAKGQYSTYSKAKSGNVKVSDEAYEVAEYLLANGSIDSTPLYQCYKRAVRGTTFYKQVGTEVFSY